MVRPSLSVLGFFTVFLLVGFAQSSPSQSASNITIGSSISASLNNATNNCWLSPSRNFAFGFHPNNVVGIWIDTSPNKTLIWTLNTDNLKNHIDNASSILLDNDGGFVLLHPGLLREQLFDDIREPASYVLMNDNGNFMIYNSMSRVIWQSFDHPTDTMVSGQILTCGKALVSSNSRYNLTICDGEMVLQSPNRNIWDSGKYFDEYREHVSVHLDSTGWFYLADGNGSVTKNLTRGEDDKNSTSTIYRAMLDSYGVLHVYGERQSTGETVELWRTYCNVCRREGEVGFWVLMTVAAILVLVTFFICCAEVDTKYVCITIVSTQIFLIGAVAIHMLHIQPYH